MVNIDGHPGKGSRELFSIHCVLRLIPSSCSASTDHIPLPPYLHIINTVPMGEINHVFNRTRPHYYWNLQPVCTVVDDGAKCPSYCADIMSTVHELDKPMDMSFRKTMTSKFDGTVEIIHWSENREGEFTGMYHQHIPSAVYGGR